MTQPDTLEAAARAQHEASLKEYGQYVARDVIFINGARAYNPGDPVPASVVSDGVVTRDQVVGANTKAATAVTEKG